MSFILSMIKAAVIAAQNCLSQKDDWRDLLSLEELN